MSDEQKCPECGGEVTGKGVLTRYACENRKRDTPPALREAELERQLAQARERERQDLLFMRQAHDLITCAQKGSESWEKARTWLLSDLHGRIGD